MSLIVAKRVFNEVMILGDTKFTFRDPSTNFDRLYSEADSYIGGLKVIVLNPGVCVAFAGEVQNALEAITGIYEKDINLFNKHDVLDYFYDSHLNSISGQGYFGTDYIVATICTDDKNPKILDKEIFKISQGNIFDDTSSIWIGDSQGFSEFQKNFISANTKRTLDHGRAEFEIVSYGKEENKKFQNVVHKSMEALLEVIKSTSVKSVDGIRTLVTSSGGVFQYHEYVYVNGIAVAVRPNEENSPLHFGGAAEGSNAIHVSCMKMPGISVFPVFYYHGKFGIIYHPTQSFSPIKILNTNIEDFKKIAREVQENFFKVALEYQEKNPEVKTNQ